MALNLVPIEDVNNAITDFNDIQQAINDRGVLVENDVPTSEYADKIREIGGDDWVRPIDRPPVPVIAEGEQVIYWLFGVQDLSPNDFAIQLTTSAGQYRIEWGDGT